MKLLHRKPYAKFHPLPTASRTFFGDGVRWILDHTLSIFSRTWNFLTYSTAEMCKYFIFESLVLPYIIHLYIWIRLTHYSYSSKHFASIFTYTEVAHTFVRFVRKKKSRAHEFQLRNFGRSQFLRFGRFYCQRKCPLYRRIGQQEVVLKGWRGWGKIPSSLPGIEWRILQLVAKEVYFSIGYFEKVIRTVRIQHVPAVLVAF